jgi:hypothetical protein
MYKVRVNVLFMVDRFSIRLVRKGFAAPLPYKGHSLLGGWVHLFCSYPLYYWSRLNHVVCGLIKNWWRPEEIWPKPMDAVDIALLTNPAVQFLTHKMAGILKRKLAMKPPSPPSIDEV